MSSLEIKAHEWQDVPACDDRAHRQCKRCLILDYRVGIRWRVQWPCIIAQDSWSLAETKQALIASGMKLGYVEMLVVKASNNKQYAGLLVPDPGKYSLSLHPASSVGTLYAGKALALFFNWAQSVGFDLDQDEVLQQRLASKTGG